MEDSVGVDEGAGCAVAEGFGVMVVSAPVWINPHPTRRHTITTQTAKRLGAVIDKNLLVIIMPSIEFPG